MKVLNGSITKCDCGSILEYDRSDVVHAIEIDKGRFACRERGEV